ncbi:transcriptional regulator family: Fungal Specific TF [Penicillium roqueforti]|nr:transcriptional regulator family: Fungal Specific TF [Penicillium roqueforti]KAI2727064.1 transcriptional regulator family: Fungal Specific TF [Penicillium roqueforti]KAI3114606.1 transcriptional regulator family: Fungal Specific TF [Penicillium roqueforti]KAI3137181.1 transcriptional regulator family: Fungal Specific TF [Penicillium roqueforti]KAI3217220.1 transcriptional regulator family: Fungal Specific TF [Penicillium roqueforti]
MKPTDKHFRCDVCQRAFTRIDHLKRHHLRHSGQKPYSCVFCNDSFARCDNLRVHYTDCARRGDREIPETGQRGRRRHACQSCTSMKLRCDGRSPCGSCQKRNLICNNERTAGSSRLGIEKEIPEKPEICEEPSSDRGSIKFLLNGGTDSFTENFRLPPHSDRTRSLNYHNTNGLEELQGIGLPYNIDTARSEYGSGFIDCDPVAPQFFQDTFLDFFHGPFGDGQKPTENSYHTGELNYRSAIRPGQHPTTFPGDPPIFEPERPFATTLIHLILTQAWQIPLDAKAQEELSANLNFLLTTTRIRKYIMLYFKYWQPSCAMLPISFDPETVPLPLLAAVVFMGAMYSSDQREVYIAKRVLDLAELFIFANDVFSAETEIRAMLSGGRCYDEENSDWEWFQNFQAGFIITIVQYWAGNRLSRNRAMENRFGEVVKVARRIGLVKSRHLPDDQVLEHLWIQKECRIRTISMISLLDCAFFFFQNYPCRLTHTEMECDLPCDELLFFSEHPFAETNFRFSRGFTLSEAFKNLFDEAPESNPMDLTALDMFILIHILFSFINTHMTFLGSFICRGHFKNRGKSVGVTTIPEDSILVAIRTALSRWRDYWIALRNRITSAEWASMGFYRNGYNFWLVSQLLITRKDAVDVVMQMEVHCEDKLEKLKVLLLDDQEDV